MTMFQKILENIHGNHVYIRTHNFPDPDAIASAFALQKLLEHYSISSRICYGGKIDRFSTNQMVEHLGIQMYDLEESKDILLQEDGILVDTQIGNSNLDYMRDSDVICVDHHPAFYDTIYRFSDVRPDVGACVSIVASYYLEEQVDIPVEVATAIVYGLKIDTANLSRGVTKLDLDVFYQLYPLANLDYINMWEYSTLQLSDMKAYAYAISNIEVIDDVSFANTGSSCPEALIANISDFMLSIAEVRICIVCSVKESGIKLSVRSERNSYNSGEIAYRALQDIGNGGGHYSMAGGFVPCGKDEQEREEMVLLIKNKMFQSVDEERQKQTITVEQYNIERV